MKTIQALLANNDIACFPEHTELSLRKANKFIYGIFTEAEKNTVKRMIGGNNYLMKLPTPSNRQGAIDLDIRRAMKELFDLRHIQTIKGRLKQKQLADKLTLPVVGFDLVTPSSNYELMIFDSNDISSSPYGYWPIKSSLEEIRKCHRVLRSKQVIDFDFEILIDELPDFHPERTRTVFMIGAGPLQRGLSSIFKLLENNNLVTQSTSSGLGRIFAHLGTKFAEFCSNIASCLLSEQNKFKQPHLNISDESKIEKIISVLKQKYAMDAMTLQLVSKQFKCITTDYNYQAMKSANSINIFPFVSDVNALKCSSVTQSLISDLPDLHASLKFECSDFYFSVIQTWKYVAHIFSMVKDYSLLNLRADSNSTGIVNRTLDIFLRHFEQEMARLSPEMNLKDDSFDPIKLGQLSNLFDTLYVKLTADPLCNCRSYDKFTSLFKIEKKQCAICSEIKETVLSIVNFKLITYFERMFDQNQQEDKENFDKQIFIPKRRYYQDANIEDNILKTTDKRTLENLMQDKSVERLTAQVGFMQRHLLDKVEQQWLQKLDSQFKVLPEEEKVSRQGIFVENMSYQNLLNQVKTGTLALTQTEMQAQTQSFGFTLAQEQSQSQTKSQRLTTTKNSMQTNNK